MGLEYLQHLADPASPEQFDEALQALCQEAGMERYLLVRLRGARLENVIQLFHNAVDDRPVEGMRHWSLVRLLDHVRAAGRPLVIGEGATPAPELPGYASGVACMANEMRGACMVYFAGSAPALAPAQILPLMRRVFTAAQHSLSGLVKLHAASSPLSDRELDCLRLFFFHELSSRETGAQLDISARTVEHYLESARAKLGAETTIAAACRAVDLGWMEMPPFSPVEVTG